jgi:hypothetical protein
LRTYAESVGVGRLHETRFLPVLRERSAPLARPAVVVSQPRRLPPPEAFPVVATATDRLRAAYGLDPAPPPRVNLLA